MKHLKFIILLVVSFFASCENGNNSETPELPTIPFEAKTPEGITPTISKDNISFELSSDPHKIIITFQSESTPDIQITNINNWVTTKIIGGNILIMQIAELKGYAPKGELSGYIDINVSALGYQDLCLRITLRQKLPTYEQAIQREQDAIAFFMKNKNIVDWPSDNNITMGNDAPFYRLADSGIFMKVISLGNDIFANGEKVYFRYERNSLINYMRNGNLDTPTGNWADISATATSFIWHGSAQPSMQWGEAVQLPLEYGIGSGEINLIVPSGKGFKTETNYVIPYLYHIRYYKSSI